MLLYDLSFGDDLSHFQARPFGESNLRPKAYQACMLTINQYTVGGFLFAYPDNVVVSMQAW